MEQMRMVKEIALMKEALEGKNEQVKLKETDLIDGSVLQMIRNRKKKLSRLDNVMVSPSPIRLTRRTPRKALTPRRRQIKKISSTMPSNTFNKTFQVRIPPPMTQALELPPEFAHQTAETLLHVQQ